LFFNLHDQWIRLRTCWETARTQKKDADPGKKALKERRKLLHGLNREAKRNPAQKEKGWGIVRVLRKFKKKPKVEPKPSAKDLEITARKVVAGFDNLANKVICALQNGYETFVHSVFFRTFRLYMQSIWCWLDLAFIISLSLTLLFWALTNWKLKQVGIHTAINATTGTVDLGKAYQVCDSLFRVSDRQYLGYEQWVLVTTLLLFFRLLQGFTFNPSLAVCTQTIEKALPQLTSFLFIFIILFIGFGMAGKLAFGTDIAGFSTLLGSIGAIFNMLFGEFDWVALKQKDVYSAVIFFWAFQVLVTAVHV
jgi:hypothetical protein